MVERDDAKPIWFTEFGWSTASNGCGVSAAEQAANLTKAMQLAEGDPYVEVALYYNFRNNYWEKDADEVEAQFGLTRTDFSKKPAYAAFKAFATGERAADPAPVPPTADPAPEPVAGADPSAPTTQPAPAVGPPAAAQPPAGAVPGTDTAALERPSGPAGTAPATTSPATSPRSRPVKLKVRSGARGRRFVTAAGRLTGVTTGTVRLTAYYAPKGANRYVRVANRWVVVRGGAFKANVSRFRRGRWRVLAALRGVPSAVQSQQFRLEEGAGDGALPPGVLDDGRRALGDEGDSDELGEAQVEEAVGEADFSDEGDASPGELEDGGYLLEGSEDDSVTDVQDALGEAGFELEADGAFGEDTEAAVRAFQRTNGLVVDGIVGRQTMAALERFGAGSR